MHGNLSQDTLRTFEDPAASCRECSALRQCFAATVRNSIIFLIRSLTPQQAAGKALAVRFKRLKPMNGRLFNPFESFSTEIIFFLGVQRCINPVRSIRQYIENPGDTAPVLARHRQTALQLHGRPIRKFWQ